MSIDPDLARVREVGAQLDERGAEVLVPQVEVVAGGAPVGLGEVEPHDAARALALGAGEHPLELLGHPDRHYL